ncbi:uncharacterized protein [Hetaerina americana]|uniref:uncharacterized protein n=1 Tax=Hetaerina americana TaxID=62018 RepID=UPI003A7F35CB
MDGIRLLLFAVITTVLCLAEGRPQTGDQMFVSFPVIPHSQFDRSHGHESSQQSSSQTIRHFRQSDNSQSLPVSPFNQYDTRGGSSQRVVSSEGDDFGGRQTRTPSQPVRPFNQPESSGTSGHVSREHPRNEEDPFQSRAHSAPLNPQITLQKEPDRQTQRHQQKNQTPVSSQQDNRKRKDETPNWAGSHTHPDSSRAGDGRDRPAVQHQASSTPLLRDNRRTSIAQESKAKPGSRGQQGGDRGSSVRMGTVDAPPTGEAGKAGSAVEEGIVFPGPTREGSGGKSGPGKFAPLVGTVEPNCAKGSTFCESTDNYPSEYLKTVLKNEGEGLKEFFGNDLLLNDTTIAQRIDSIDENPLCQSVEQVVYPKMAQNKEDKWLYVVNQDQYIQGVRVEKCLKPESECLLTASFPLGYKTTCRQKYIYRRMLALNDDGKALSDTFRLPSCCSCFVKADTSRK